MEKYTEITVSTEEIYKGKIITLKRDYVELVTGQKKLREVVMHPGGVVVAAFTDNNELLMVRQYRYPTMQELIELPAGKLEYGEDPDEAIKRELEEECGYQALNWEKISSVYATPGFCTEKIGLYKATGLIKTKRNLDDGELLDYFTVPVDKAWQMVLNGEIQDMKTVALLGLLGISK